MAKLKEQLETLSTQYKTKVGVFFYKDQKSLALEKENDCLKQNLAQQIQLYNQLMKQLQQSSLKLSRASNEISLHEIQSQILTQNVTKLQKNHAENSTVILLLQKQVNLLTEELSGIEQELEEQLKNATQRQKLIKRYKEQIKSEKLMLKSQKNITKISQTTKKSYQSYQKNVQILQNKLQSKKKYLLILTKKLEKQNQEEIKEQITSKKKTFSNAYQYKSKLSENIISSSNPSIKLVSEESKSNMKSYNDLIRKKNAILARKK